MTARNVGGGGGGSRCRLIVPVGWGMVGFELMLLLLLVVLLLMLLLLWLVGLLLFVDESPRIPCGST